jgi:hypothetical protein
VAGAYVDDATALVQVIAALNAQIAQLALTDRVEQHPDALSQGEGSPTI